MKYIIGVLVIVAAIFMGIALPAIMAGINDFRTDVVSEDYILTTNETSVNGTVQLSSTLWDASIVNASVSSNLTSDFPAIISYTNGNRALAFNGLAPSTTRLITVEYKTAGLEDYQGVETGVKAVPVVYVLAIIFVPLIAVIYIVLNR